MCDKEKSYLTPDMRYGGFFPRFWALIIDGLLFYPLNFLFDWAIEQSRLSWTLLVLPNGLLLTSYTIIFHRYWGRTIGKMIAGVRVVQTNGRALLWKHAVLRDSVSILFTLLWSMSVWIILFDMPDEQYLAPEEGRRVESVLKEQSTLTTLWGCGGLIWGIAELVTLLTNDKRRAVHDFIAGTVVIRKRKEKTPAENT